jgi:hypothetical protein
MRLRFYIDPETGEPHIYRHRYLKLKWNSFLATPVRIGQAVMAPGWRSDALYLVGFCA